MSMNSAADIISYIGIPLAVVGVLPIIFTSVNGVVTVANIKKALRRNGLNATTRGSYLAGIVEVEIPRCTITPLERDKPQYWTLNPDRSDLPGGSWTIFNWNKVATGRKLYRLQYSTDLREPQAEASLDEVVAFLLDRGAVPDPKGIHMLRLAGLFTPQGTSLLLSPDAKESVLRVAMSDDSDGVLSLALHWKPSFDSRDHGSLPPSWMRVRFFLSEKEARATDAPVKSQSAEGSQPEADSEKTENEAQDMKSEDPVTSPMQIDPIRFHLGSRGGVLRIDTPSWEINEKASSTDLNIDHLQETWAGNWFPAVAAALGQVQGLALWTCHIPDQIVTLVQKDLLPCGVLVMAGILSEEDAPAWETKYDPFEDSREIHRRMMDSSRRREAERSLPPGQADAARRLRESEESQAFLRQSQDRLTRERKRRDQKYQEALNSSRLDTLVVAKSALKFLEQRDNFDGCNNVQQASERLLHVVLQNVEVAKKVCSFLNRWQQFHERGGMNIEDLDACQNDPAMLCHSICLMACIKLAGNKETSSLALDLQECVRVWKRIRLG